MAIVIKDTELKTLLNRIRNWALTGAVKDVEKIAHKLANDYQDLMRNGDEPDKPMIPVKDVTMESPIRWGGPDKRIRKTVNPDENKPIQATGATINSIKAKRNGDTMEISSSTNKGDMILAHNQTLNRDPLRIADRELDIIEDELVKSLVKVIGD